MTKKAERAEHIIPIAIDLRNEKMRPYMCRAFQIETGKPVRGPAFAKWLTQVARDAVRDLDRSHMRVKRVVRFLSEGKRPNRIRKLLARGEGAIRAEEEKVIRAAEELMREGKVSFEMIRRAAEDLTVRQDINEKNIVPLLREGVMRFRRLPSHRHLDTEIGVAFADFRLEAWMRVANAQGYGGGTRNLWAMGHRKLLREEEEFLDAVLRGIDRLQQEDNIPLKEIRGALGRIAGSPGGIVEDEAELLRCMVLGDLKRQSRKKG